MSVFNAVRRQGSRRGSFAVVPRAAAALGLLVAATSAAVAWTPQSLSAPERALTRVAQPAPSGLPGGASSLNETYKDWRVACEQQGTAKKCVLSQVQAQQNGQRVLGVELNVPTSGAMSGVLVLPFGLLFDNGVTLQLDEKAPMAPLRYRTCLPNGCVVMLNFDAATTAALKTGTALKVKVVADGGKEAQLSISLQGFDSALDRILVLSR